MTERSADTSQLHPLPDNACIAPAEQPSESTAPPAKSQVDGPILGVRGLRRIIGLFVAVAAVACIVLLCLSLPVSHAPFRLHATTSFLGLQAASDFRVSIDAQDWDISTAAPTDTAAPSGKFSALRRTLPKDVKDRGVDRLEMWIHAGDEVIVQRLPGVPAHYSITLPSQPVEFAVQLADITQLVQTDETGKETTDTKPEPILRSRIGGSEQPALRILPAEGGGEFGARVAINRLGFGHPTNHGVEAGLLTGGMQFLDKPDNELQLYRGTDLRLGNVDGEIAAAALTSDAIEVYVSGLADDVRLNVSTGRVGERSRSVMPSRYEWLKGQPVIAVALGFVASIVGAVGLLLSAAGAIPPFSRWLHRRLVREER